VRFAFAILRLPLICKVFKRLDILLELAKNEKGSVVHPFGTLDTVFFAPSVFGHDEKLWVSIHIHATIRGLRLEFINPIHPWLRDSILKSKTNTNNVSAQASSIGSLGAILLFFATIIGPGPTVNSRISWRGWRILKHIINGCAMLQNYLDIPQVFLDLILRASTNLENSMNFGRVKERIPGVTVRIAQDVPDHF
jgi:hypothetical protein